MIAIVKTRSIVVAGMSCDHCANAIRAEISKLPVRRGRLPDRPAVQGRAGTELGRPVPAAGRVQQS